MRIVVDIPEWAYGRHINIFAGNELLGKLTCTIFHKEGKHMAQYSLLKIKPADGRCNGCGSCCGSNGIPERLFREIILAIKKYHSKGSKCVFLGDNGCILKGWIPFSCAKSVCTDYEGCTERIEVIP